MATFDYNTTNLASSQLHPTINNPVTRKKNKRESQLFSHAWKFDFLTYIKETVTSKNTKSFKYNKNRQKHKKNIKKFC